MAPYWEAIRVSIRMQPLVSGSIHVGDEVSSPYGLFTVDRMFKVIRRPPPSRKFFFNLGGIQETMPVPVRMCSGRLTGWKLGSSSVSGSSSASSGTGDNGNGATDNYPTAVIQTDMLTKLPTKVLTLCYDCEKKSQAPFHYLGLECLHCHGFNTVRV
jgi:hypothetical protein